MIVTTPITDARLQSLYRHWLDKRHGRAMPGRADIDPLEIPATVWPHIMILEVVDQDGLPRFRYRRAGAVFWRALQREPTGLFVDEALPETAGYRHYVLGIYHEMLERRCPLYTENEFALEGRSQPVVVKRVSLPLSSDGEAIDMVISGHVFEHEELRADWTLSRVRGLKELLRTVLTDE